MREGKHLFVVSHCLPPSLDCSSMCHHTSTHFTRFSVATVAIITGLTALAGFVGGMVWAKKSDEKEVIEAQVESESMYDGDGKCLCASLSE